MSEKITAFGVVDDLAGQLVQGKTSDGFIVDNRLTPSDTSVSFPGPKAGGGPEEASAGRRSTLQSHRDPEEPRFALS